MTTRHIRLEPLVTLIAALGLLLVSSGAAILVAGTSANAEAPIHKSYVCKYVQKPGAFEILQGGGNPIWVDNHALIGHDGPVAVGDRFQDGQILSVVIVANTPQLDPEPGIDQCPALEPPPDIEVTAAAPTFVDPTCTTDAAVNLPTTEGVTYTVSGTVAEGETVTVTATADEGYVLVGQTVWEHTFATVDQVACQPPPEPPVVNPPPAGPPAPEEPPAAAPPASPPAAGPPPAAPPVTPSVVRSGQVHTTAPSLVSAPMAPDHRELGLGLLAAGMVLVLGAGARTVARSRGGR